MHLQHMMRLLGNSKESMVAAYKGMGWSDILHSPPIDVAMNILDYSLQAFSFQASTISTWY